MGNVIAFLGAAWLPLSGAIIAFLVIGGFVTFQSESLWAGLFVGLLVAGVIFGASAAASAYTPVDYGTVQLVTRFGRLTGEVFEPGLQWKTPFIERTVTIRTVSLSYETSNHPDTSQANFTDFPVTAQTSDGQQITIRYTVLFHIAPEDAVGVAQAISSHMERVVQNVVKANSRNLSRLWAQRYTAEDLFSGEGIFAYQDAVGEALCLAMAAEGVTCDDFLVRKIDFDEEYVRAIELQQIAQEAIETREYEAQAAEFERDRQITLSEADARRQVLLAESQAEQQRLLADAEAYSIETRGAALRAYPEMLQLEFINQLENVTWGIMPDTGINPLLQLPTQ
jgi:regulator of protease activity HflC (stomatin/prohibitin superfamily)